jgi:hypothetical protein
VLGIIEKKKKVNLRGREMVNVGQVLGLSKNLSFYAE